MRLVFITNEDSQYSRSILGLAEREGIRFAGIVVIRTTLREKLRLARVVLKRSGLNGFPYYLWQKRIEATYHESKLDKLNFSPISHYQKDAPICYGLNSKASELLFS